MSRALPELFHHIVKGFLGGCFLTFVLVDSRLCLSLEA